jgi:hypothetical protein
MVEPVGCGFLDGGYRLLSTPTLRRGASLTWPVLPFNPYRAARETDLRYAVGWLRVPLHVEKLLHGALNWGRQDIDFALEAASTKPAAR